MPEKYHIKTQPVPPRQPRIGKHGVVDWREDCARCHNCVKKACVYDRYRQEADYIRTLNEVEALFFDCMGCFSCVQDCTKDILCLSINPATRNLATVTGNPTSSRRRGFRPRPQKSQCPARVIAGRFPGMV